MPWPSVTPVGGRWSVVSCLLPGHVLCRRSAATRLGLGRPATPLLASHQRVTADSCATAPLWSRSAPAFARARQDDGFNGSYIPLMRHANLYISDLLMMRAFVNAAGWMVCSSDET